MDIFKVERMKTWIEILVPQCVFALMVSSYKGGSIMQFLIRERLSSTGRSRASKWMDMRSRLDFVGVAEYIYDHLDSDFHGYFDILNRGDRLRTVKRQELCFGMLVCFCVYLGSIGDDFFETLHDLLGGFNVFVDQAMDGMNLLPISELIAQIGNESCDFKCVDQYEVRCLTDDEMMSDDEELIVIE